LRDAVSEYAHRQTATEASHQILDQCNTENPNLLTNAELTISNAGNTGAPLGVN
jgi:hypothetical protein